MIAMLCQRASMGRVLNSEELRATGIPPLYCNLTGPARYIGTRCDQSSNKQGRAEVGLKIAEKTPPNHEWIGRQHAKQRENSQQDAQEKAADQGQPHRCGRNKREDKETSSSPIWNFPLNIEIPRFGSAHMVPRANNGNCGKKAANVLPRSAAMSRHPDPTRQRRSNDQIAWRRGLKEVRLRPTGTVIAAFWITSLITGSFFLTRYEQRPGSDTAAPSQWPSAVSVPRDSNLPTLVMFLHPYCPCSRASVGELALIMARCHDRVVGVVMVAALGGLDDPQKSSLWRDAELIPGVTVLRDQDGVAARRFHATTSGRIALYDKNRRLLFAGGITSARAHSGDNTGRDSIVALIAGNGSLAHTTPTFGCPIFSPKTCDSFPKYRVGLTPPASLPK